MLLLTFRNANALSDFRLLVISGGYHLLKTFQTFLLVAVPLQRVKWVYRPCYWIIDIGGDIPPLCVNFSFRTDPDNISQSNCGPVVGWQA
jgi:hypothetical protein